MRQCRPFSCFLIVVVVIVIRDQSRRRLPLGFRTASRTAGMACRRRRSSRSLLIAVHLRRRRADCSCFRRADCSCFRRLICRRVGRLGFEQRLYDLIGELWHHYVFRLLDQHRRGGPTDAAPARALLPLGRSLALLDKLAPAAAGAPLVVVAAFVALAPTTGRRLLLLGCRPALLAVLLTVAALTRVLLVRLVALALVIRTLGTS